MAKLAAVYCKQKKTGKGGHTSGVRSVFTRRRVGIVGAGAGSFPRRGFGQGRFAGAELGQDALALRLFGAAE